MAEGPHPARWVVIPCLWQGLINLSIKNGRMVLWEPSRLHKITDILANYYWISQPPLSHNTCSHHRKKNDGPSKGCSRHQRQVMAVHFAIKRPDLPSDWPLTLILPSIFAFLVVFLTLLCWLYFTLLFSLFLVVFYSFILTFLVVYLCLFCRFLLFYFRFF